MIPQIIAHRGASYLAPENTLAAFRKAMEIGADGVEMDVQKTLDGGLVIHHDYIIDLHTDISGRIYDMTEGELKDLDFGSWKDAAYKDEKIATLAEALALCRSMEGCAVQLEMKSTMDNDPAFVSGVVDAIRAADIADRLVLISFNHDLLRQAKALMPELRVGVLLYGAFESMVLPPPVIWKDLGLVNGMEDEEAALDEELAERQGEHATGKLPRGEPAGGGKASGRPAQPGGLCQKPGLCAGVRQLRIPHRLQQPGLYPKAPGHGGQGGPVDRGHGKGCPEPAAPGAGLHRDQPPGPRAGMGGRKSVTQRSERLLLWEKSFLLPLTNRDSEITIVLYQTVL